MKTLIVISPEVTCGSEAFPLFDAKGNYVAGQTRMQAAVRVYKKYPKATLVMVGGCILDEHGKVFRRAKIMTAFMRSCCPLADVREVHTLPCTFHNFCGIFEQNPELLHGEVGLVSNNYHQERALLMWQMAAKRYCHVMELPTAFFPAEEFVCAKAQQARFSVEYKRRLHLEREGLAHLKGGLYTDKCLNNHRLLAALSAVSSLRHLVPETA
jgi:hypothetical protein